MYEVGTFTPHQPSGLVKELETSLIAQGIRAAEVLKAFQALEAKLVIRDRWSGPRELRQPAQGASSLPTWRIEIPLVPFAARRGINPEVRLRSSSLRRRSRIASTWASWAPPYANNLAAR
jgi:hypothetical protein